MTLSAETTSFTEYRRRLREQLRRVKKTRRPLYVTTNGQRDAVVLSPEAYDALAEKAELVESLPLLKSSAAGIKKGRAQPAKRALKRIARPLGLGLDR